MHSLLLPLVQKIFGFEKPSISSSLNMRYISNPYETAGKNLYMYIYMYIHSLVFSLEGRAWQEPDPSHVTGMALAHCNLGNSWG